MGPGSPGMGGGGGDPGKMMADQMKAQGMQPEEVAGPVVVIVVVLGGWRRCRRGE